MTGNVKQTVYTVGYGGRGKEMFQMLAAKGIRTLVDVRLRPDRASMGLFAKAKEPDRGIAKGLQDAGVGYVSIVELGNMFGDSPDWRTKYRRLLDAAGDILTDKLASVDGPYCLMCAEKNWRECHRAIIADYLRDRGGVEIIHLV